MVRVSRSIAAVMASSNRVPPSLAAAACAGVLATATMDAAMLTAAIAGGQALSSKRLGLGTIGRWAARLLHGRWRGEDISREAPVPGEVVLGLAAHYATGTALTAGFVLISGRKRRPLTAGLCYGVATSALPLFVMFPSMGFGWCGARTGEAPRMVRTMLVGHVAFGAGIGFWTRRFIRR